MSKTLKSGREEVNKCVGRALRKRRKYEKSHFEPKIWTFDETNALMNIWSKLDLEAFESKQSSYRHISIRLKKLGFDRNQEQIRTKIQRIHRFNGLNLLNTSANSDETVGQQSDDVLEPDKTDDTSHDSTSDLIDFTLTDTESESEDSLFGGQSSPKRDMKLSDDFEEKEENEKLFESLTDLMDVTTDCFEQIMSAQQQLQESIESFNQELNRLSDILNTNNTNNINNNNNFDLFQNLSQESKPRTVQKFVIPNVNKKFIMDLTDNQ